MNKTRLAGKATKDGTGELKNQVNEGESRTFQAETKTESKEESLESVGLMYCKCRDFGQVPSFAVERSLTLFLLLSQYQVPSYFISSRLSFKSTFSPDSSMFSRLSRSCHHSDFHAGVAETLSSMEAKLASY